LLAAVVVIVVVTLLRTERAEWRRWWERLSFRRVEHVR
jgi:hypothetical protein